MRSINKVIIVGNLTRDPDVKRTSSAQAVATFGIATNREWVTQTGERKDSAEFHEVVAFSRLAEICGQFLKKGNLVYVEGYLKTRSWIDEVSGQKRYRTEIVVTDMIRLEKGMGNSALVAAESALTQAESAIRNAEEGANAEDAFNSGATPYGFDDNEEEVPATPAPVAAAPVVEDVMAAPIVDQTFATPVVEAAPTDIVTPGADPFAAPTDEQKQF